MVSGAEAVNINASWDHEDIVGELTSIISQNAIAYYRAG
jgi:hypothetical protein